MVKFAFLAGGEAPYVLLWGTEEWLILLANLFRELPHDGGRCSLGDQWFYKSPADEKLSVVVNDEATGLAFETNTERAFNWSIDPADLAHFADLIEGVATGARPCHNYLDGRSAKGITVRVSKGEWPENFLSA